MDQFVTYPKISTVITYAISLPVLLIVILLNEFARLFVSFILIPTKYSLIPSGWDAIFAYLHDRNKDCMIAGCIVSETKDEKELDLDSEIVYLQNRVFNRADKAYTKLTLTLSKKLGYSAFYKGTFSLRKHVRLFDEEISESELRKRIIPSALQPMSSDKPQWEWWILPRVTFSGEKTPKRVRVFRFNHAYFDGPSATTLFADVLMDWNTADGKVPWILDPKRPHPNILAKLRGITMLGLLRLPLEMKLSTLKEEGLDRAKKRGTRNYFHFWSKPLPTSLVKSVAKATNSCFTSVLVHALAQAFCTSKRRDVGSRELELVKVSVAGAVYPYPDFKGRNRPFSVVQEARVQGNPEKAEIKPSHLSKYYRSEIFGRFPHFILDKLRNGWSFGNANLHLRAGNLPITKAGEKGLFKGDPVTDVMVWFHAASKAVDVVANFITYDGKVRCCVSICDDGSCKTETNELRRNVYNIQSFVGKLGH